MCLWGLCTFVATVLLFFFSLPFPGHTHTQLLSVSMRLTILKIAVQSMLDLLLHQSHTSRRVSFFFFTLRHLCHQLGAVGEESQPQTHRKRHEREKIKSLVRPPLLLSFSHIPDKVAADVTAASTAAAVKRPQQKFA